MTCREFIDFLVSYFEGALPEDVKAPFEHHLSQCEACERYLSQYRITIEAGKAAFAAEDPDLPEDVPEELISAILESRRRETGRISDR